MNILVIGHTVDRGDGQGRINAEIVRHCLAGGHGVTVFADQVDPSLADAGARLVRPKAVLRKPGLLKVKLFTRAADRFLSCHRADYTVVVANGGTVTGQHDLNLCQFVHGAWIDSPVHVSRVQGGLYGRYQKAYSFWNSAWEQTAYAAAGAVIAPSEHIARELRHIGVAPEKIHLIYNGVDIGEFTGQPSRENRAALGLPVDVPLALFVGDIRTTRKNLDTVLAALPGMPSLHLAVVGAVARSPFPALAAQLGIAERVHFLDFRTDIPHIMAACDLFAFPSRYEAGSLVLLEAMASGLPVITARSAGGSELVGPQCGFVLENPDDVTGLQSAMQQLATDPALRQTMGRNGREVAVDHTWTKMAGEYVALMETMKDRRRSRATSSPDSRSYR